MPLPSIKDFLGSLYKYHYPTSKAMNNRIILIGLLLASANGALTQNVGIGTTSPHATAMLHVEIGTSNSQGLLVTGSTTNGAVPNLGGGSRLMFYPGKAAFRAGGVEGLQWNDSNTGIFSMATGRSTVASGGIATAMGYYTIASGIKSTALGSFSTASGEASTAMGNYTIASGSASTAMGSSSNASGIGSTAMGFSTFAVGEYSTAMGYNTIASGNNSATLGYHTVAKAFGSMSVGVLNDDSDNPGATTLPTDRIFQIGNGTLDRSNALTVLRSGNTGVGVLDPAYRLDLAGRVRIRSGGTSGSTAGIWLNKNDNTGLIGFVGVDANNSIGFYASPAGWSLLVDANTGNTWVKGTVTANGVTLTSDERLKTDITPLGEAMPILEKLHGYQYHWKDASWDASLQTGLLAQEVEKVLPELVKTDDKGMKSVNYIGLIPYMLEAVNEQHSVITTQQKQIEELKKLVTELLKK